MMKGEDLIAWRRREVLTQSDAAALFGCTKRQVIRYEAGETPIPESVVALMSGDPEKAETPPPPKAKGKAAKAAPIVPKLHPAYVGTREQAGAPKGAERPTDEMRDAMPGRYMGPNVWFMRHNPPLRFPAREKEFPGGIVSETVYRGPASGHGNPSIYLYGHSLGVGVIHGDMSRDGSARPNGGGEKERKRA